MKQVGFFDNFLVDSHEPLDVFVALRWVAKYCVVGVVVFGQQVIKSVEFIEVVSRRHIPHKVELSLFFGHDIGRRELEREPSRVSVEPLRAVEGLEDADVIAEVVQATVDNHVTEVAATLCAHEVDLVAHRVERGDPLEDDEGEGLDILHHVCGVGINLLIGSHKDDLGAFIERIHSERASHAVVHEREPWFAVALEHELHVGEAILGRSVHVKIHESHQLARELRPI